MISSAKNTKSHCLSDGDVSTNSVSTVPQKEEFVRSIAQKLSGIGANSSGGIHCKIEGNAIVLLGTVRSFYSKQQVQEVVKSLKLPMSIDNRCVVEETIRFD